ncbi:MAG TPA: ABC transporter permease [Actinomycetota bacterium]
MSRWKAILKNVGPRFAAIGGLVAVWWLVSRSGFFDRTILPSPATVWRALVHNFSGDDGIAVAAEKSLLRLAIGLGLAIVVGTSIGVAMAASETVRRSVGALMTGLQALPSISWLPLAILWFGLTERAILFVVIIAAIPAVALATTGSVRLVPPLLVRAGRTLGARGWRLYREVVVPAAIPGYVAGLTQSWAFAWRALMAGELIATGARGLGHLQDVARQQFDAPKVMAVMVMIVAIGMAVDFVLGTLDRRVRARRGLLTEMPS